MEYLTILTYLYAFRQITNVSALMKEIYAQAKVCNLSGYTTCIDMDSGKVELLV